MTEIMIADQKSLPALWLQIEPYIKTALKAGTRDFDTEAVWDHLMKDEMRALVIFDDEDVIVGCCVLELVDYPKLRACRIVALGGKKMNEWIHLLSVVEKLAESEGATRMEFIGREGWQRVEALTEQGYRKAGVLMHKRLEN